MHRSCPLSISCVSKHKKVAKSVSRSVSPKRSDHRIRKRSIASLDILITLTLYKLERPPSGTEFCLRDRIHFRRRPGTWFVKKRTFWAHFRALKLGMRLKSGFRRQNSITRMHLISCDDDILNTEQDIIVLKSICHNSI